MAASLAHRAFSRNLLNHILHKTKRCMSSAVADAVKLNKQFEEGPNYPSVKPKYPPGSWGNMDYNYAWKWFRLRKRLMGYSDVQRRLNALLHPRTFALITQPDVEHRIHNFYERVEEIVDESATAMVLDPVNDHPATLEFRQYVTKTQLLPWEQMPSDVFESVNKAVLDEVALQLKERVFQHLQMKSVLQADVDKERLCKSLIRCVVEALITELGKHCTHLRHCQYDENVTVNAIWSRHGFERKIRKFVYDPDISKYSRVRDQGVISKTKFDAMLRSHLPLPEFEARRQSESENVEPPKLLYKPLSYGQSEASNKSLKSFTSVKAGHKLGDPCEFGLVGFLSTSKTHKMDKDMGSKVAADCRLGMGLTHAFTWLAAQACNQGFNHVIDVTYPLTSQVVLTDGHKFSFLAYQLNTLELWKDDEANHLVNRCWHSKEMPLYTSTDQGEVQDINDEVIRLLVQSFMLAPASRDYDMKPKLRGETVDLSNEKSFVPKRVVKKKVVKEEKYIVS